jgi:arginine decarboxylase
MFHQFFGENMLRADVCNSVDELGQLLDHSGPVGAAERNAARIFNADHCFFVTNGTSTSNKMVWHANVAPNDIVVVDRNCHVSILHAITMTGAIPVFLPPTRNHLGIIGPIPLDEFRPENIQKRIEANPFAREAANKKPRILTLTQSTYDGIAYNVEMLKGILNNSIDTLHFDEAWLPHAAFHDFYRDMHAIGRDRPRSKDAIIFATHSTHKLLAALSQASFLHVRDGRSAIPHERFNESFMMHSSTSPLYPIIVSNDITAAMMDGPGGMALTSESIEEAVAFRQTMGRVHRQFTDKGDWFFNTWNPTTVVDGTGFATPFEHASPQFLAREPRAWVLRPRDLWHGFADIDDGYCMLDPIKVSVITPGVAENGGLDERGVPATLVTAYLHRRGVEVEKTTDFTILFLFSIGITKGKWGTLLNALLDFKRDYDANTDLRHVLPQLIAEHPDTYAGLGLRELGDEMFAHLQETRQTHWLAEAFSTLPRPVMTPHEAYQRLVRGHIEHVPLDDLADRVLATSVVPYPPGIPMLMPGESTGESDGPYLSYLRALSSWDRRFPGFGHDTHGVNNRSGTYWVQCLTDIAGEAPRRRRVREAADVLAARK